MAHNRFQFQVLLAFLLFTQSALSLKCYICNSGVDVECAMSPTPAKFLQECTDKDSPDTVNKPAENPQATSPPPLPSPVPSKESLPLSADPSLAPAPTEPVSPEPTTATDKNIVMNRPARAAEDTTVAPGSESTPSQSTSPQPQQAPQPQPTAANMPTEPTFCRKISYHIPAQMNGENSTMKAQIRVIRSCGYIPEEKKDGSKVSKSECKLIASDGTQMDMCVCFGDGCNSGNFLVSLKSQTLVLLAVVTAGFFYVL